MHCDRKKLQILAVENDNDDFHLIDRLLADSQQVEFVVSNVESFETARARLQAVRFDAVLLDLNLGSGIDLKNITRCAEIAGDTPVIVLTGFYDDATCERAIGLGAEDYIAKDEMTTRLLSRSILHSIQRKSAANELLRISKIDSLTGLPNRRGLEEYWKRIQREPAQGKCAEVVFVDIDKLKPINDQLGHKAGDELICLVAKKLQLHLAEDEIAARVGGDEFVVVLKNETTLQQSELKLSEMSLMLNQLVRVDGQQVHLSVSLGQSHVPDIQDAELHNVIAEADKVMFANKQVRKRAG